MSPSPNSLHRRSFLTGLLAAAGFLQARTGDAALRPQSFRARPEPTGLIDAAARGLDGSRPGIDRTDILQRLVDESARTGATVLIPPGDHLCGRLRLTAAVRLSGAGSSARLLGPTLALTAVEARLVSIEGLSFARTPPRGPHDAHPNILDFSDCPEIDIAGCRILGARGYNIALDRCGGRIEGCDLRQAGLAGLFSTDAAGLFVADNEIADCGNGGILVHRSENGRDGTLISRNRISGIGAKAGGTGQNGNGINVFRAGNVIVAGNHVEDCAFSAIRSNAGSNVAITGNTCLNSGETAIYSEFGFEGALIEGNIVDGAAIGISIANFGEGGRLAVCSGNLVRNLRTTGPYGPPAPGFGVGLSVEADTVVSGNVVEGAPLFGIKLGWGPFLRDVSATGNVVRDCGTGIAISTVEGSGAAVVSSNIVSGSKHGAIVGYRWSDPSTSDLLLDPNAAPPHVTLSANRAG